MENRPIFCSECGAKLTGSATFCSRCGAKQEFIQAPAAPVVETPVVEAPVVEAPVVEIPAPAPAPAPVPAPAPAPATSLAAPKETVSVFGLILAIGALCLALIASASYVFTYVYQRTFGFAIDVPQVVKLALRNPDFLVGLFTSLVVPLIAMVMVLTKKKPAALVGLILGVLLTAFQLAVAASYVSLMKGRPGILRFWPFSGRSLINMVTGESLFDDLRILRMKNINILYLMRLATPVLFHLKNWIAVVACLAALLKKRK